MKKKKFLVYTLSMLIPVCIFLICTYLNGFLPFKDEMLNSYDSFTQYPGMLLEYIRGLQTGNIFYSWRAGLGFNLFGTITYYCISPLNLLAVFATPSNYHFFIVVMTFIRFALLGFTMCFYLSKKNIKPALIVIFSTIYALMGYTSTYYYNYIWIDSIIMLPLVIHGLDKLIEGKNPLFYIISLTLTICINYYIGYMICIFSLLWFIYKNVTKTEKLKVTKTFIFSSLLSGLMSAVIILPSVFALMTGKASIYGSVDYSGFTESAKTFFYTLTTGTYLQSDQILGPALIYSSILVLVLTCFYFFNTKFTKKQKIATLIFIIFFYLSFSLKFLNYTWQLFQKPIWWQSRFSFTFSFFLIIIAANTLMNIEHTKFKMSHRIPICLSLIGVVTIGAIFKLTDNDKVQAYTYFLFGFSILLILEMFFLLDKKGFLTMLLVFTLIDVSLNTFNSLKQNYRFKSYTHYDYIKKELPPTIEELNKENDNFYRLEFIDDFTSNDGLYFGFNGINYFNSARNVNVVNLMDDLGLRVTDRCHFVLTEFDPVLMSIFNIKYLYGRSANYYKEVNTSIFENPHPLSLGFTVKDDIKDFYFKTANPIANRNNLLKTLSGHDADLYKTITFDKFTVSEGSNGKYILTHEFKSDGHYLIMPEDFGGSIKVNDLESSFGKTFKEISKGDKVIFKYSIAGSYDSEDIKLTLFNLDAYEEHIKILEKDLLQAETNVEGHILKASIDVTENNYLFTSIEHEEGMKVYIDDNEVQPDIILDSLIGLPLEKGHHTIIIDYIPKGFTEGLLISIYALIVTIGWNIYSYKKKIFK